MRPSKHEAFAFEVVGRVLGAGVEHRDTGTIDGEVDAHIVYTDHRAALEVTTVGDQASLEVENVLQLKDLEVPGLSWYWEARYGPGIPNIKSFSRHMPVLLRSCEGQAVTDPRLIKPTNEDERAAVAWYLTSPVKISGYLETNRPGAIDVLPAGSGGAVDEELDGLCDWVRASLQSDRLCRRTKKLARSDLEEKHLYLIVHQSAVPFSLFYELAFGSTVPKCALELPGNLSHLWLVTGWREGGVLLYTGSSGWTRCHPFE